MKHFPPLWLALLTLALPLWTCVPACAWNDDGHKLVAEVAYPGLTAQAKKNVDFLLVGTTLDKAATWPDYMRTWQRNPAKPEPAPLVGDPQATLFFSDSRNVNQPSWHFVDIPNGWTDYATATAGTGPDDIVHALRRCIAVLRGQPLPGENLNAPQALRLLIHYVGDIHQPLHAASGYWVADDSGGWRLATNAEAASGASDRGGNQLHYGTAKFDELHGFWDFDLVENAADGTPEVFAAHLSRLQAAAGAMQAAPYTLGGDPAQWPEQWADESAKAAANAYAPLGAPTGGSITPASGGGEAVFNGNFTLPADYLATFKPVADKRLALAGYRLAATLNATLSDRNLTGTGLARPAHPRHRLFIYHPAAGKAFPYPLAAHPQ